jgi:sec-independent protein translocase protein TatC
MPNESALTPIPDRRPPDPEDGLLRMSLLEHMEELRSRLLKALAGIGVAFALTVYFGDRIWHIVAQPVMDALRALGYPPRVIFTTPTEAFLTVWMKMPLLVSLFLASPWILYQFWAFVAPGLYRKERRWSATFVIISCGLFILGGAFGYFLAFRYGLEFLLGIGKGTGMEPLISVSDYFELFVEVMVGIGLVFELPVLIFLLTALNVVTPSFLIRNSHYAILLIVIVAALVTPSTDAFNLMLFATPMVLLYFIGVLAAYLLVS